MKFSLFFACLCLLQGMAALQASPLEDKILALFEAKCADCHKDDNEPELSQNSRLTQLYGDAKLVVPGDSKGSRLLEVLLLPEGHKDRMPKSTKKQPRAALSSEETALMRQWIDGEGDSSAPRSFVSATMIDDLILADLQAAQQPFLEA